MPEHTLKICIYYKTKGWMWEVVNEDLIRSTEDFNRHNLLMKTTPNTTDNTDRYYK